MPPQEPVPLTDPPILTGIGTDATNAFEDLSGLPKKPPTTESSNPYDTLISACNNSTIEIRKAYDTHRTRRNASQIALHLAAGFPGPTIDPILTTLLSNPSDPTLDPRNCFVFWARPSTAIVSLILDIQTRLRELAPGPGVWLMPKENLHMTVLELVHSTSEEYVANIVERLGGAEGIREIVDIPRDMKVGLSNPMVSFDAAAVAVSFLPTETGDKGYHHLRREFYEKCCQKGVTGSARYVVPSAHITIARFVGDIECIGGVKGWVEGIEGINKDLAEYNGCWMVGEERGVDCRIGRLWYGGGETVARGTPFE